MSEFVNTKKLFREAINYKKPLSFDEWNHLPHDHKAAALFVQFYDEITLAWHKVVSFYASEEEGVETMLQYLMKNVSKIEDCPRKFSSHYIYRVAYNCLYCICHDRQIDKDRWSLEISNIVAGCGEGGEDLDLFDSVGHEDAYSCEDDYSKLFWSLIEDSGVDTRVIADIILSQGCVPTHITKKESESFGGTRKYSQEEILAAVENIKCAADRLANMFI